MRDTLLIYHCGQIHGCSVFLSCVLGQFGLYQFILRKLQMKHRLYKMSACEDLEKHSLNC